MTDLIHYMLRPTMPLPNELVEAIGGSFTGNRDWTWARLTDPERVQLFQQFPPVVTIATLNTGDEVFTTVTLTTPAAQSAIERAFAAHVDEHRDCCGDRRWASTDETNVITGQLGSVWRDGSLYPKGDN